MKIISYNILNGFCGDNPPFVLDEKRMKAAAKILNKEKPDILILQESFFWPFGKYEKIKDYNNFFQNLYKTYNLPLNYFRWAPICISKFPIEWKDNCSKDFKFVQAKFKIRKRELLLYAFHPSHDLDEEKKEIIVNKIISEYKPDIIVGDLNSLSPQDKYNEQKLLEGFKSFMGNEGEKKVIDLSKKKLIQTIIDQGFKDTFLVANKKWHHTIPTDFRSKNKNSGVRIDYIFCSKDIKVIDAGIVKNKLTERASDHYPVYAVLESD